MRPLSLLFSHSPLSTALNPSSLSLNIFKLPSFSSTPLSMSSRSVSDVLMAAARAAASKSKKRKTQDDGATTNKNPNPTPPSKDPKPTAQPKEEEKPTLGIDDRIAALLKKPIDFKPHSAAFWKDGESIPFLFLARALDLIAGETGRIVITEILCNVFRTVMATKPQDLTAAVYLSANRIAPSHEGVELGIGDAALIKALAEAYGRKEEHIKNQLKVIRMTCAFFILRGVPLLVFFVFLLLFFWLLHVFVIMSHGFILIVFY